MMERLLLKATAVLHAHLPAEPGSLATMLSLVHRSWDRPGQSAQDSRLLAPFRQAAVRRMSGVSWQSSLEGYDSAAIIMQAEPREQFRRSDATACVA